MCVGGGGGGECCLEVREEQVCSSGVLAWGE